MNKNCYLDVHLAPLRNIVIDEIKKFIGVYPEEHGFKKRIRFHQGWWRAFVLAEEQGNHPINEDDYVCNMIRNGQVTNKNLLTSNVLEAVRQTIHERIETTSGIIAEDRLFNNLLSSQPLCFNFWGELKMDTDFALQVLKQFWPEITEVHKVIFEYAPKENYTEDNSAFDVAFEVMSKDKRGLIGLECKYTDSFSSKAYDRDAYKRIYEGCKEQVFFANYDELKDTKFNQLFRNQLIAEALKQNNIYAFVYTGLFCYQGDENAKRTALDFQSLLKEREKAFWLITYDEFIEKVQQLDLSWEQREWTMMLWARYCGLPLSSEAYRGIEG